MKIEVVDGGDFRFRWKNIYVTLEDIKNIEHLIGDDYEEALFCIFESGFSFNDDFHVVVDY